MKLPFACLLAAVVCLASCGGDSSPAAPSVTTSLPSASSACGAIGSRAGSSSVAIVNGAACSTDNSAVVLLNMRDSDGGAVASCSGTVVAPRAVLTAAHCLGGNPALVRVFRGSGLQVDSASFTAYPGYRESDRNALDVAVIIVRDDLQRPAMPILASRDARVGEQAVVAGWGLDGNNQGTVLRAGFTTVTSVGGAFLQSQYTVGAAGSGVCSGDSGGPLLVSVDGAWAIAGVTSGTSSTACVTGSNFYANLRNGDIRSFVSAQVPDIGQR